MDEPASHPVPVMQDPNGGPWMADEPYADSSSTQDAASQPTTAATQDPDLSDANSRSTLPNNRRRRITRACDECRRKKIKCDGLQPCTHCTVYSYDCTYDQPSHRRRNPAPQYVESLEKRLHRAEAVVRMCLGAVHLEDPDLDTFIQQSYVTGAFPQLPAPLIPTVNATVNQQPKDPVQDPATTPDSSNLESMIQSTGKLELDERGFWDYHGHSSNIEFLRRLREDFGVLLDPSNYNKDKERAPPYVTKPRKDYERIGSPTSPRSPRSYMGSPVQQQESDADDLPSREIAAELCSHALDDACAIIGVVHRPSFQRQFDRIYSLPHKDYEDKDHRFLPLLYVVMALGCLFARDEQSDLDRKGYQSATDEGFKYFWDARQLIDVTDCRDLTSLQAIIFMSLFLQCSSKLATCYAYIGVALRSALRMGLHRSFRDSFNPVETQLRKTLFWVIRKMDIYVGTMIGLPLTLSADDIDQEFPLEVDDEYITEAGINPMPEGTLAINAAANANFKLTHILSKIVKSIYPIKGFKNVEETRNTTYSIGYTAIRGIENDLQEWLESLPEALKPGGEAPMHRLRVQYLLRMAYAHAQMILYRPFLHYITSRKSSTTIDPRAYACGAACISVSRNIIHITADMTKRHLLVGSYWFTMYTTFFAILSLVFYVLENQENPTSHEIIFEAREGRDTLASLAKRSMAADRCMVTLNALFEGLPEDLRIFAYERPPPGDRKREDPTPPSAYRNTRTDGQSEFEAPKRAKTSPQPASQQQQHANIAPRPQKNFRFDTNNTMTFAGPERRQSQLYAPSMTPEALPAATTSVSSQQQMPPTMMGFGQQQIPDQYQSDITQHSAVMFPSADPFAYPNHALATLEQNDADQKVGSYGTDFTSAPYVPASTAAANSVSADDHIDVQLFGPLPAHLMQGGQHHPAYQYSSPFLFNRIHQRQGVDGGPEHSWGEQAGQHGFPSMSFHDIFGGEEWTAGMSG